MSDIMRTALKGGGSMRIAIDAIYNENVAVWSITLEAVTKAAAEAGEAGAFPYSDAPSPEEDNLELLCRECHALAHAGELATDSELRRGNVSRLMTPQNTPTFPRRGPRGARSGDRSTATRRRPPARG